MRINEKIIRGHGGMLIDELCTSVSPELRLTRPLIPRPSARPSPAYVLGCLGCSVVEGTKPFVQGHIRRAVIAVEIAMVQLVMKLAQCEPAPVPDLKIGKAQMRGERIKGLDMHMEQHEQGI